MSGTLSMEVQMREKTRKRSIRLPVSMWEWIENLPPDYGTDDSAKIRSVLYRGKRVVEKEIEARDDAVRMVTEPESQYKSQAE